MKAAILIAIAILKAIADVMDDDKPRLFMVI